MLSRLRPSAQLLRDRVRPGARAALGRLALVIRGYLAGCDIEVRRTTRGARHALPSVLAHYVKLGLDPATVIDVGVAHGTPELYRGFPMAHLVLVEPLDEWRGHLERISRQRPATIVDAAAGTATGSTEISVHRAPVNSSLLGARTGEGDGESRTVRVVRIDDIVDEHRLAAPFVIKVDVEGGELRVLGGALESMRRAELILLEVALFELVPGAPQLHDVVAWMHQHGFVVADVYNGHNRLLDDSLAVVDIAFVQENGRFRGSHAYATAEQAEALYRSWGF